VIICGKAEITGATFIQGLPGYFRNSNSIVQNSCKSIIYMMSWEDALLVRQLKGADHHYKDPCCYLNILPLGQLLEKFHLHEATDRRDKVFALLGVCLNSDRLGAPPQPDYEKSWSTVFGEVITYLLGPSVKVRTWDDREQATMKGFGCPLGKVKDLGNGKSKLTTIDCGHLSGFCDGRNEWSTHLQPETYCKDVMEGDILWLMDDAPSPCIIRLCEDHFDVIVISVDIVSITMKNTLDGTPDFTIAWESLPNCTKAGSRHITLVWDWLPTPQQTGAQHMSMLEEEQTGASTAGRLMDCARIFDDLCDKDGVKKLLTLLAQAKDEPQLREYIRLLTIACTYWESYVWLKLHVEELRWCLHRLKSSLASYPHGIHCYLEYWKKEGCLKHDLTEIAALANAFQTLVYLSTGNPSCNDDVCWDFGQSKHTKFLLDFFSERAGLIEPRVESDDEGSISGRRLMFCMMKKHQDFESSRACLSVKEMIDLNPWYDGKPDRIEYVMLALISDHCGNALDLASNQLDKIASERGGAGYLSFLLTEAYNGTELIYNILAAAIRNKFQPSGTYINKTVSM
jgi:hypothetical protein